MIWTEGWYHAEHEQPGCWAWSMSIEEHSDSRWAILWRYRLALARAEVAAFKARLERVGADTTGERLEAENAKLRKCVEAADAFFLVEDAMSNATEEGVGKDLWIESQEHRNSYDAARAEVGE